ncbi:Metaxin-like protein [Tolypocladium ophioglossoides CBS 100239]|uniref:Metaxin-like protein n=1 Tax=Tolypocladium ophioglossoides (strain CBS 100239) TaxID=1163406 RepID=A0A0L0NBQ9_TOLOC|nr:Metaxin-like protein [Tolypocladium ophioglossoides CBS 100239]
MLDLHVWGAAFGLPSIDPECLAIITFLHHAAPSSAWRLIPSNDPSISPSHLLPALHHDGVWTSGYHQIVGYLTSKSICRDLDADLDAGQQADSVAYSAYLSAHAAPLIDLSLYVSAANWAATTRPAYSSLLAFPLTWTAPPLIRAEAIKRVEHLGLAELDTDFDPNGGLHLSAGRDVLPETFRRHLPAARTKKTVRDEMTPEQAVAIRLFSLAEDCLSVLDALIGKGKSDEKRPRFFAAPSVSSLDCLAYGYLALMLKPPVPRSFLRDWLQTETPRLSNCVDDMAPGPLPWATPEQTTIIGSGTRVADSIIRNAPSLGAYFANEMRQRTEDGVKGLDQRALMLAMSLMVTGAAVGYGLHMYKSLQPFGARTQLWTAQRGGPKLSQFGQLGSMLSSAMGTYAPQLVPSGGVVGNMSAGYGRLVEVDSEVD